MDVCTNPVPCCALVVWFGVDGKRGVRMYVDETRWMAVTMCSCSIGAFSLLNTFAIVVGGYSFVVVLLC